MLQIGSVVRKNIQYDKIHYIRDGQHWYVHGLFLSQTGKSVQDIAVKV
jgi:hypothetical protein